MARKAICVLCLFIWGVVRSQNYYRVKRVGTTEFLLPPRGKIACEGIFHQKKDLTYKERFRYQYVAIRGLHTPSYFKAVEAMGSADYFHSRIVPTELLRRNYCDIVVGEYTRENLGRVYVSPDSNCLVIEVDYTVMLQRDITFNFWKLAVGLLTKLSEKENVYHWPKGIAVAIVRKIFEFLPAPAESVLVRYGCRIDNDLSFVLLDHDIQLRVDGVERPEDENGDWQYRFISTNIISLTRNDEGDVIQDPFHVFHQHKQLPGNKVSAAAGNKDILQASSEDIQLSNTLKTCPYIFLWQNNFKKNNICCSVLPDPSPGTEKDIIRGNAHLVHYAALNDSSFDTIYNLDRSKADYFSSFGYRNLIVPVICICINGDPLFVPLHTTFGQLSLQRSLPSAAVIHRLWNGKYRTLKNYWTPPVILLPGDEIKY